MTKYSEYDIQTACNIATGDDEQTGKEVVRVLKVITSKNKLKKKKDSEFILSLLFGKKEKEKTNA